MGEFFHGWRRKAGAATLVMACVLMVGWMRSTTLLDFLILPRDAGELVIHSTGNRFSLHIGHSGVIDLSWGTVLNVDARCPVGWGLGQFELSYERLAVPYWVLVLPLTLLSGYLLLWKSRKRERLVN